MVFGISVAILAISLLLELPVIGFWGIEQLRVHRFNETIYGLGWPLVRRTLPLPSPSAALVSPETILKEQGKFKFITPNRFLFTPQWRPLFLTAPYRSLRLKGTATWGDNGLEITGRLPLGPTLFLLFWLTGWTAGCTMLCVRESVGMALLFGLWGWGILMAIIFFNIRVERKSMDLMIAELEEILRELHAPIRQTIATNDV